MPAARHLLPLLLLPLCLRGAAPVDPEIVPPGPVKIELAKLADFPPYVPRQRSDGTFELLTRAELVAELRQVTGIAFNERGTNPLPPPLPRISCRFDTYSIADHAWFRKFLFWFNRENQYLRMTYRKESWDCDDYSCALNAMADLSMVRSKFNSAPHLIGRLIVSQQNTWAGTPAGGVHEIMIFRSNQDWWVVEPQNGTLVSLQKYPNRTTIREILFN